MAAERPVRYHRWLNICAPKDMDVLTTREPGGTEIGDQVRKVIMDLANKGMNPRTEILLFQASRVQIVEQVIRPALQAGKVVICDRYADSTLAYQGYGHQTDLVFLNQLLHFVTGGLKPDLTLFLDVEVEEGLRRRQKGGGEWNRLDDYDVEFHREFALDTTSSLNLSHNAGRLLTPGNPKMRSSSDLQAIVSQHLSLPQDERKE